MNRTRREAYRPLLGLLLLPLLPPLLGACGVKGRIEEPEGQESVYVYPRRYPDPDTVVPGGTTGAPIPRPVPEETFGSERRSTTVISGE